MFRKLLIDSLKLWQHMPTHSSLNPDVEGSFEVTLARGLNMTHEHLPIQITFAWYKRRFLSLAEHERQELAAGSTVSAAFGSKGMHRLSNA